MTALKNYQMYIDGQWVDAEDGDSFTSVNPATGEEWARIPAATAADVDRAVNAAHRAFTSGPWSTMLPTERGALLRNLAELMKKHSEMLGRTETVDTGKLFTETRWQAAYLSNYYHYYAGLADKVHGATLPIDKPNMWAMTVREPLGVVAAVVPWNSQLFLVAVKIAPALAAGNTVVLKASEHASAAMLEFGKVFEEAGFPPGVINIVTGTGDPCGAALTSHPLVDRISFTGGLNAAQQIIRNSAENFAEVSLELGGKSPMVIFDDVDIENAVNGILLSIFSATGQSCVAGSRLLIQDSMYDQLIEKVAARAAQIRIGDPLDDNSQMGPLATLGQLERIEETVANAIENGATLVHGGKVPDHTDKGWYYEPTIVSCPSQNLRIVREEMFGPVVSALKFSDEEEAVALANDSRFGLAAGVFTRDIGRALRVTKAIRAGIVWVNTYRVVSPMAPFGGFKDSGHGRESGLDAIYDYTRAKTVWLNTSPDPIDDPFRMQ
ncbi:MAG: aldehyde dehydrogenase [Woeseia sp.]|jgi:(Z)-2-((N-methylformamido)methylene)-5-hydroxybutyrolactone dehydrogenase|nr:aldehyde dehydrogenase [Woeseia sp.]